MPYKFMSTGLLDAQLVRALGAVMYQGAEIGECFAVSERIKGTDRDSWHDEWSAQGDKNFNEAVTLEKNGFKVDARRSFMRACTYYRSAYFFLEDNPSDVRIVQALDKSIASFHRALALFDHPVKIIEIPYENNVTLPAYLYLNAHYDKPLPIVINCAGGDGTKEEAYPCAYESLARGYHCLNFEGPGQGAMLRKRHIPFRPDWEYVAGKVIDYVYTCPEVDTKNIIYLGRSFGAFLAARAATKEKRITTCVVDPGQFDQVSNMKNKFQKLFPDKTAAEALDAVMNSKDVDQAFIIKSRLWRYGATTTQQFVDAINDYTLEGIAENISCPTLVFDNAEEYLTLGQAQMLYDNLTCKKKYHVFQPEEYTGGHCEPLIPRIFYSLVFQWIEENRR